MDWQSAESIIVAFVRRHADLVELYLYMLVVTMRPKLPWPLNKVDAFNWAYEWQRSALISLFEKIRPGEAVKTTTTESVEVQTTIGKSPPETTYEHGAESAGKEAS